MPGVPMPEGRGVDNDHCKRFQDTAGKQASGEAGDVGTRCWGCPREDFRPDGERRAAVGEGECRSRRLRPGRRFGR